jgi:hypothetical protein
MTSTSIQSDLLVIVASNPENAGVIGGSKCSTSHRPHADQANAIAGGEPAWPADGPVTLNRPKPSRCWFSRRFGSRCYPPPLPGCRIPSDSPMPTCGTRLAPRLCAVLYSHAVVGLRQGQISPPASDTKHNPTCLAEKAAPQGDDAI